jgi:hypothetical protein
VSNPRVAANQGRLRLPGTEVFGVVASGNHAGRWSNVRVRFGVAIGASSSDGFTGPAGDVRDRGRRLVVRRDNRGRAGVSSGRIRLFPSPLTSMSESVVAGRGYTITRFRVCGRFPFPAFDRGMYPFETSSVTVSQLGVVEAATERMVP